MATLPPQKPVGNAAPEAAAEGAPPPDSTTLAEGEPNVTPEEQAEYDQFMQNALQLIYSEESQVRPEVLESLQPGEAVNQREEMQMNPAILSLANTAVTLVTRLDDSAREQGKVVSDDVLMHGGVAIIEELGEIASAAKIFEYSEEDLTGAYQLAVDMYRPKAIAEGRTTEETLKGQFAELNEADQAGRLGDVLPGLPGATVGEPPVQPE